MEKPEPQEEELKRLRDVVRMGQLTINSLLVEVNRYRDENVDQLRAELAAKQQAYEFALAEHRKLFQIVADCSLLLRGRRSIPVWIMYKDGEERTFAMTTSPPKAWAEIQQANGYVIVQLDVPVPCAADLRLGVVPAERVSLKADASDV